VRQPVLPRGSAIAATADCDKHLRVRFECRHTLTCHLPAQVRYQPHRDQTATKVLIHRTLVTPGDTQFACQARRYRQAHKEESVLQ
jgi:hypothetical protein